MRSRDCDRELTQPQVQKPLTRAEVQRRLLEGVKSADDIDPKLRSVFDAPESDDTLRLR